MKWHLHDAPCKGDYRCSAEDFRQRLASERCKRCEKKAVWLYRRPADDVARRIAPDETVLNRIARL
jgi:hypothetical protein